MKIHDYLIDVMKNSISKLVEPSDTAYGSFCKGYRYAKENEWISEKFPEEFEDLIDPIIPGMTKTVLVRIDNDRLQTTCRLFDNKTNTWNWPFSGVTSWKCID